MNKLKLIRQYYFYWIVMFCDCHLLTILDFSSFYTSNVNDIKGMFLDCSNIIEIQVGNEWDTTRASATYTYEEYGTDRMFERCGTDHVTQK